jgi:uncharacterized phage-associated protein
METPLAVANYFLHKSFDSGSPLTPIKLEKLAYLAHAWHLAVKGEPLLSEAVQAWKYGPVIASLYHTFLEFGIYPITRLAHKTDTGSKSNFPTVHSQDTIEVLDKVWEFYKPYSDSQLSSLTHKKNSPWEICWRNKEPFIPNHLIQEHYINKLNAPN